MEYVINIVGFLLLWSATDVGRGPESKVKMFSGNWWLMLGLITLGVIMGNYHQLSQ